MSSLPLSAPTARATSRLSFPLAAGGVLLLSYSVLTFEVALTRIFSVMLSYHFVFAIVSVALAGLGGGALLLGRWRRAYGSRGSRLPAVLFAVLVAVSVLAVVLIPAWRTGSGVKLWLYLALAVLPFLAAGLALSEVFERLAERSSVLYAADLAGAAAGALAVVPLLDALGAGVVFLAAATAALGALLLGLSETRLPVVALASFVALAGLFAGLQAARIELPVPIANDTSKDMYRLMNNGAAGARIVASRWSSFGRTDLVSNTIQPNEMTLFVDGAAGSAMYNLKAILSDPSEAAHITLHYGGFFPFLSLEEDERDSALIVGPGGGRDVVVALLAGVTSITAVEVNPDVVRIVKDYTAYNGGIYSGANGIRVYVDEGRHFVRSTQESYDAIMLSIPVTKSSRSVEGYALTENYLFTVEAFEDYLDRLTPEGRIIVVAHSHTELYRLISLAAAALGRRGVSEREALGRMYTVGTQMLPTLVVQNRPLEPGRADKIHQAIERLGLSHENHFIPSDLRTPLGPRDRLGIDEHWRLFDRLLEEVAEGRQSLRDLARAAPARIGPVTDDRPFFYNLDRGLPRPFGVFALLIVAAAGLLVVVVARRPRGGSAATFGQALRSAREPRLYLLLFVSLGAGFMLVEIALFQKLMLYIGQPQRALSVLLAALLLGGGIGAQASAFLGRNVERHAAAVCLAAGVLVAAVSILFPLIFLVVPDARVAAVIALLPLGFVLGVPFPLAIRSMKARRGGAHVHAAWGVNGVASVLGSALSMIVGLTLGFAFALYLGAASYVGAAALAWRLHRRTRTHAGHRAA